MRDLWDGITSLEGKRVLVDGRGYLGDAIHYSRYVPRVKAAGASFVIFLVPTRLVGLMKMLPGVDLCADASAQAVDFDYIIPLTCMSKLKGDRFPPIPHSPIPADRVAEFRRRIPFDSFNIGLCWRAGVSGGHPGTRKQGVDRDIPLSLFWPAARIRGLKFFSLQRGGVLVAGEISNFPIVDLEDGPPDILNTAAAMLSLDLIITVDSMPAHLAGSLGCRVWTALLKFPDWRWGQSGSNSLLYPTMRLFRQSQLDDWGSVVRSIQRLLTPSGLRQRVEIAGRAEAVQPEK